jgi:hypothetical protein
MVCESRSSGRPRSVRSAVAAAVVAADLSGVDQALGQVAVTLAAQLDKLGRAGKGETPAERARRTADVVRVSRELRGLLRDLPLRSGAGGSEPGGGGGDDDDDPGEPDDVDAELARIMGAGATMGDPAHI